MLEECKHSLNICYGELSSLSFYYIRIEISVWKRIFLHTNKLLRWRNGRAFALHTGDWGSNPSRDRPKSNKEVVTDLLPNTRQQVWVSGNVGGYHYKGLPCVTIILTAQWQWMSSIGQTLKTFTGNGGRNIPNKQTNNSIQILF